MSKLDFYDGRVIKRIGTSDDAAGTTTLFARVRQIVDTYLADSTIGLNALKDLVDAVQAEIDDATYGLSALKDTLGDAVGADLSADIAAIQTEIDDATYGLAAIQALVDGINDEVTDATYGLAEIKAETSTIDDKLGEDDDLFFEDKTVLGYANTSNKHVHNPSYVVPDNCTTIDPQAGDEANKFGAFVEIINSTAVALDFHWANVYEITQVGNYIVEIHQVEALDLQASEKYLGAFNVSRLDNFTKASQVYTQIPVIPAGKRVACRVKSSLATEGIVKLTVTYHDYQ